MNKIAIILTSVVFLASLISCTSKPVSACFIIDEIEIDVKGSRREIKLQELGGFKPGSPATIRDGKLVRC